MTRNRQEQPSINLGGQTIEAIVTSPLRVTRGHMQLDVRVGGAGKIVIVPWGSARSFRVGDKVLLKRGSSGLEIVE